MLTTGDQHTRKNGVSPLAFAVGVTIENELPLEQRFDRIHQGVANHPVPKWRSVHQPSFWFFDFKTMVTAGLVGFILQFPLRFRSGSFRGRIQTTPQRAYNVCPAPHVYMPTKYLWNCKLYRTEKNQKAVAPLTTANSLPLPIS